MYYFDEAFYREMQRIFNNLMMQNQDDRRGITRKSEGFRSPEYDIQETDEKVIADIELPGIKKDEIELYVTDSDIEIKAKSSRENQDDVVRKMKTSYYRKIPIAADIEPKYATATFQDAILHIDIPKSEKSKEMKKRVEVR